jgi:hypothetical protein
MCEGDPSLVTSAKASVPKALGIDRAIEEHMGLKKWRFAPQIIITETFICESPLLQPTFTTKLTCHSEWSKAK